MRHPIIEDVVTEHALDAAFLWQLRDAAVSRPHYRLGDLIKLDDRVAAHLDGLTIAGDEGWEFAKKGLTEMGGPGEVFASAVLAFESGRQERIAEVVEVGMASPKLVRALISALGWLRYEQVSRHLKSFLASESTISQRIGLAASAIHRRNPGTDAFNAALASDDHLLRARALRASGELGLVEFQMSLRAHLRTKQRDCRFWAAWSKSLFQGNKDAVAHLQQLAESDDPFCEPAAHMAIRRLAPTEAKIWLKRLVKDLGKTRIAIVAAGAFADSQATPFLIDQMNVPELARVAGESFSMVTGVRLDYDGLEGQKPKGFESGPTESPEDDDVAIDPDENLPWPDPERVRKWWADHRGNFAKGTRYLLGQPITPESLRLALKNGYQRQRAAAALELAILKSGRPLFEVRAPGWRQQHML